MEDKLIKTKKHFGVYFCKKCEETFCVNWLRNKNQKLPSETKCSKCNEMAIEITLPHLTRTMR